MKKVAIIMGSDSDLPIVQKGVDVLRSFGVPYEVHVFSAHRTPFPQRHFTSFCRIRDLTAFFRKELKTRCL